YGRREPNGRVGLVILAEVDMREIGEVPPALKQRDDAAVLLVDTAGVVAAGYPQEAHWPGRDLAGTALMRAVESRTSGTVITPDPAGVLRIWGFRPLPSGRGHLLVGLEARAVGRAVEREMTAAYAQLALAVALML